MKKIIKRNGRIVDFDKSKITDSIYKAAVAVGGSNRELAESLSEKAISLMGVLYENNSIPTVEEVQDIIEKVLVETGHYKSAKAYILYRAEHAKIREKRDSRVVVEDNIPYKLLWR